MVKFKKRGTKKRKNEKHRATTQKGGLFKGDKQYLMVTLDDPSISDYDTAKMVGVNFNLTLGKGYLAAAMEAAEKDQTDKLKLAVHYEKYAMGKKELAIRRPTEDNETYANLAFENAKMARAAADKAIAAVKSVQRWVTGNQLLGQIESPDSGKNKGDPLPIIPYNKVKERADVSVMLLGQFSQDERYYLNEKLCKRRDMGLRFSNLGLRSKTKDPRYKSALDYVLKRNKLITLKLLLKCGLLDCPDIDIVSAINHRLYNILKVMNDIECEGQFNIFKIDLEFFNTMIIVIVKEILSRKSELRKLAVYLDKRLKQLLQNHTTVPKEFLALISELLVSPEGLYTLIYKNLEDKSNILSPRSDWVKVVDPTDNAIWYENETIGVSQWTLPEEGVDNYTQRIQDIMKKSTVDKLRPCAAKELAQYRSSGGVLDSLSGAAVTYTFTAPAAGALAGGLGGGGFGGGGGCIFV